MQLSIDGFFIKKEKSTDWKWSFKDYPHKSNGLKVFSCFSCGGGSTMGYKLAGCEVIGNCEIDPRMNEVYIKNHKPKFNYCMDIRDFNNLDNLPDELYNLDILDGSPPCTTFSMAGEREKNWGKKKKFREGQKEQTLDDLSFIFIKTVNKLKPKCAIMENVEGLIKGAAWSYVQRIYTEFNKIGYDVKHYLLKGEEMGVPQRRHRVFFIAVRKEFNFDFSKLNMQFNYELVTYGEIKSEKGILFSEKAKQGKFYKLLLQTTAEDKTICDIIVRNGGKKTAFQQFIIRDNDLCPTIRASRAFECYRYPELTKTTLYDVINAQTFPQDYDFGAKTHSNVTYICGMSVPPIMIKRIVTRLLETDLFNK